MSTVAYPAGGGIGTSCSRDRWPRTCRRRRRSRDRVTGDVAVAVVVDVGYCGVDGSNR